MPELADTIGTLEGEILVAKIQLDRALAEWQRWQDARHDGEALGDVERRCQSEKDEMQRRRPDLHGLIDRCLSRIGRLQQQAKIQDEDDDLSKDPEKAALEIREALVEMAKRTGITPGMGLYRGRAAMADD